MSSRWATSTSRRGASGGAANRLLTRTLLLLPAVFLQENPAEQHRANRHGSVGNVERPEAHVTDTDVDEIHDDHADGRAPENAAIGPRTRQCYVTSLDSCRNSLETIPT